MNYEDININDSDTYIDDSTINSDTCCPFPMSEPFSDQQELEPFEVSSDDEDSVIERSDITWELQKQPDTCAVVAEMCLVNQFISDDLLTQEQAVEISEEHGWYQPGAGTSPKDIGRMMDLYNIANHSKLNATIRDLAQELQSGHGVIVGVHADELWKPDLLHKLLDFLGLDTEPADHAVVVTGIDMSDPSQPMVIINDSGNPNGDGARYPLDQFMAAWENSDFYYTATDAPMPKQDVSILDQIDWEKIICGIAKVLIPVLLEEFLSSDENINLI